MRKDTFIAFMLVCLPLLSIAQSALTLGITGYNAKCNGSMNGSAKATASGGVAPYSYTWAPATGSADSISGLAPGVYSVVVTDSVGDTISDSITISQPAPLTTSIDSIVVPPCFRTTSGASCGCYNTLWAVVSGGTPPYSYLWTPGGSGTGGNTSDTLQNACYVNFTVTVTDSNSCVTTDSINIVTPGGVTILDTGGAIALPSAVGQLRNITGVNAYPNPATNQVTVSINLPAANRTLAVYNIMGEKVFEQKLTGSESLISIDVSGFAAGNYLLKTVSDASQSTTHFSVVR